MGHTLRHAAPSEYICLSFAALTVLHCFMVRLTFFVHTWETKPSNETQQNQRQAAETKTKSKNQLNTMCCNSFHLMKGVEPQWNYGYSGASVGHHVGHKES